MAKEEVTPCAATKNTTVVPGHDLHTCIGHIADEDHFCPICHRWWG